MKGIKMKEKRGKARVRRDVGTWLIPTSPQSLLRSARTPRRPGTPIPLPEAPLLLLLLRLASEQHETAERLQVSWQRGNFFFFFNVNPLDIYLPVLH